MKASNFLTDQRVLDNIATAFASSLLINSRDGEWLIRYEDREVSLIVDRQGILVDDDGQAVHIAWPTLFKYLGYPNRVVIDPETMAGV